MQPETQTTERKLITVALPVALNRRVNVICAMKGIAKQKFVEAALRAEVERAEATNGAGSLS